MSSSASKLDFSSEINVRPRKWPFDPERRYYVKRNPFEILNNRPYGIGCLMGGLRRSINYTVVLHIQAVKIQFFFLRIWTLYLNCRNCHKYQHRFAWWKLLTSLRLYKISYCIFEMNSLFKCVFIFCLPELKMSSSVNLNRMFPLLGNISCNFHIMVAAHLENKWESLILVSNDIPK